MVNLTKNQRNNLYTIIVLVVVTALLRIPTFFEPLWYSDEGLSLTVARSVSKGIKLYRGIHDNKPPLFYWLLAVKPTLFWAKLVTSVAVIGTILGVFFLLLRRLSRKAAALGALFCTLLLSIPSLEGNIANGEILMVFPTVLGVYFGLTSLEEKRPQKFVISGIFFALASLIKIPAVFDFLAFIIFLFVSSLVLYTKGSAAFKFFLRALRNIALVLFGFFAPWLIVAVHFLVRGTWREALFSVFLYNFRYVHAGDLLYPNSWKLIFLVGLVIMPVFLLMLLKFFKGSLEFAHFTLLWFSFSLFAALISGRPYTHYLLQVVPALSSLVGLLVSQRAPYKRSAAVVTVCTFFSLWSFLPFYRYATVPYYANFGRYYFGDISKEEYFEAFGPHVVRDYEISKELTAQFPRPQTLLVWGDDPAFYYLTGFDPAAKFFLYYHMTAAGKKAEVLESLRKDLPPVIIVSDRVPELPKDVAAHYDLLETKGSMKILQVARGK